MMNWFSVACFVVAVVVFASMFKRGGDILSPARVFVLTWSLVFGLANLKLSRLQWDWTGEQWVYVLMGPCSFLLGLFAAYVVNLGHPLVPLAEIRARLKTQRYQHRRLLTLIAVAFGLYIGAIAVIDLVKGPIPLFAANPSAARTEFSIFAIGLLLHNMPVIVFFGGVYHVLSSPNGRQRFTVKMIVLITLLSYLALLQRYQLIMVALLLFTLTYYSRRQIRLRTVFVFLAAGVLVIYVIATLRAGQIIQVVLYKTSEMRIPPQYAIFTEPYMYFVIGVENLVHAISKLDHHTFGFYTIDFALALTGLKHPIQEYFGFVDTPYLFSGYNTYTMFWNLYRDFGVPGITVLPMAGGAFIGFLYYSMRRAPSIERVTYYGVAVFTMALSFFVSILGFLWFVYFLGWTALIFRMIRPISPGAGPSHSVPGVPGVLPQ